MTTTDLQTLAKPMSELFAVAQEAALDHLDRGRCIYCGSWLKSSQGMPYHDATHKEGCLTLRLRAAIARADPKPMPTDPKPLPQRCITAIRRRLGEVESMAWILRLLLDGAELPGVDLHQLRAEVERVGNHLDGLAKSLAGKFVRPATASRQLMQVGLYGVSLKCEQSGPARADGRGAIR